MSALLKQSGGSEAPALIVALDFPKASAASSLVSQLDGLSVVYKIGLELFTSEGPAFVRELVHAKKRVFLDLKLHDIPNTVVSAVRQAALLQVEFLTLHLTGGRAMVRAVLEDLAVLADLRPKILGVSVLTSFDDVHWAEVMRAVNGHAAFASRSALGLIEAGVSWGIDGVVCSPQELSGVRERHPSLFTVVPGIRMKGDSTHDQARVLLPEEAARAGASAVVVGRSITQAPDPRARAQEILAQLRAGAAS